MYRCESCKQIKSDVYEMHHSKNTSYRCRECNTRMVNKYRESKKGKEAILRAELSYNRRNRHKVSAWYKAKKIPLQPCEVCGNPKSLRHHADYSEPLNVKFLCALHHKEIHKNALQ